MLRNTYETVPGAASELGLKPYNLSFRSSAGEGWICPASFAVDQGPVVLMIENHRSGLVWELFRRNRHVAEGLRRAGFQGGWL
jgi:hypothetical protein